MGVHVGRRYGSSCKNKNRRRKNHFSYNFLYLLILLHCFNIYIGNTVNTTPPTLLNNILKYKKKGNCHSTLNFFLLFNLHMAASMFMGMIIDLIIIWEERVDCFKMIDCRKHCLFFYTDIITVLFAIYISITPLGMLRIMFCYSYSK